MEITFPTPAAEVRAKSVPVVDGTAWNSSSDAACFLKTVLKHIYTEKILCISDLSQGSSRPTLKSTQLSSQLEFEVQSSSYITAASGDCTELVLSSRTEKEVCWAKYKYSSLSTRVELFLLGSQTSLVAQAGEGGGISAVGKSQLPTGVTAGLHCVSSSRRLWK